MFREGQYLEVIKTSEYCAATVVVTVQEKTVEIRKKKISTNKWLALEDWAALYEILEKALRHSSQKFDASERKKTARHFEAVYYFETSEDPNSRTSFPTIRVRVSPAKKRVQRTVESTKDNISSSLDSTFTESPKNVGRQSLRGCDAHNPLLLKDDSPSTRGSPLRIPEDAEVEEYIPDVLQKNEAGSSRCKDVEFEYVPSAKSALERMQLSTDSNEYSLEKSEDVDKKISVSLMKKNIRREEERVKESSSSSLDSTSIGSHESLKNKTSKSTPFLPTEDSPLKVERIPTNTNSEKYTPDELQTNKADPLHGKDVEFEYIPSTRNVSEKMQLFTDFNEYSVKELEDVSKTISLSPLKKKIWREVEGVKESSSTSTESHKSLKDKTPKSKAQKVESYYNPFLPSEDSTLKETRIPTNTNVEEYIPNVPQTNKADVEFDYIPSTKNILEKMLLSTDSDEYSFEESEDVSKTISLSPLKKKIRREVEGVKESSSTSTESHKSLKDKTLKSKAQKVDSYYNPFLPTEDNTLNEKTIPTNTKVEEFTPVIPQTNKADSSHSNNVEFEYSSLRETEDVNKKMNVSLMQKKIRREVERTKDSSSSSLDSTSPETHKSLKDKAANGRPHDSFLRNGNSSSKDRSPSRVSADTRIEEFIPDAPLAKKADSPKIKDIQDPKSRARDSVLKKKFRRQNRSTRDSSSSGANSASAKIPKSQKDRTFESRSLGVEPHHPVPSRENSPQRIPTDKSQEYVPSKKSNLQRMQVTANSKQHLSKHSDDPNNRIRDSRLKNKFRRKVHSGKDYSGSAMDSAFKESVKCVKEQSSKSWSPKAKHCRPVLPREDCPSRILINTEVEEYIPDAPQTKSSDSSNAKDVAYVPSKKSVFQGIQVTAGSKEYPLKESEERNSKVKTSQLKKKSRRKVHSTKDNGGSTIDFTITESSKSITNQIKTEPYHPILPREGSPPRITMDTKVEEYIPNVANARKSDTSDAKDLELEYVPSIKSILERMQVTADSKEYSLKESEDSNSKVKNSHMKKKSGRKVHSAKDNDSSTIDFTATESLESITHQTKVEPCHRILSRERSPSRILTETDVEEYIPNLPSTKNSDLEFEYVPSRKSALQKMQLIADSNEYVPTVVSEEAVMDCALDNLYVPNSVPKGGNIYEIYEPSGSVDLALANEYVPNSKGLKKKIEEYQPDFTSKRMKFDNSYVPSSSQVIKELKKSIKRSPSSKRSKKDYERRSRDAAKKGASLAVDSIKWEM